MLKRMMKIALGSEVDKNYVVEDKPIATGGPHFCWKVYNAVRKATHEEVSVFIFKDSSFQPEDKPYKDDFLYLLRQGVKKLTMLRHPYILKVIEVMPENPKEVCFVAERVTCSLANMCNDFTNLPKEHIPKEIKEKTLSAFEATCGIIHLCEGLMFLHDTAKLVHLDLAPENIWITPSGTWKLAGLGFSLATDVGSTRYLLDCGTIPFARFSPTPDMDYASPELSTAPGNFSTASDMWSLGCLIWELFSLGQEEDGTTRKLVNVTDGNPATHAELVRNLQPIAMDRIPQMLQSSLMSLLNMNPSQRASATAMKNCPYFTHGPVQTMQQLETLLQLDEEHQKEVLKNLLPALAPFPEYLLESMVMPKLEEVSVDSFFHSQLSQISDFAPFILPCVLYIAERAKPEVFNGTIVRTLEPMLQLTSPPELVTEVYHIFLGHLELLLEKGNDAFKSTSLLPMLGRCIQCGVKTLQLPVLHHMDVIAQTVDKKRVKEIIVPRLQKLVLEGTEVDVRTKGVECLCSLLPIFEKKEIQNEVLNVYKKLLAADRDPALITMVTRCYTTIGKQFGAVVMAQTILPKVTYLLAEPALERDQFAEILQHVEDMLQEIRTQREEEFVKRDEERAKQAKEEEERAKHNPPPKPAKPSEGDLFTKSMPPPKPVKPGKKPSLPPKPGKSGVDDMFGGMDSGAANGDMFGGMDSTAANGDMFGGMDSTAANGDMFGGMDSTATNGDMFGGMDSGAANGDMFGGMDSSQPPKTEPMNDNVFAELSSKPAASNSDMFGEMGSSMNTGNGDMFGGMESLSSSKPVPPPKPAKPAKPATINESDFAGLSGKPAMSNGDMFGGMGSSLSGLTMGSDMLDSTATPSKPSNDMFGGMNSSTTATNGDMFGGMDPVSQPSNDAFGGMSAPQSSTDMFGGMSTSQPSNDAFSGMNASQPSNDAFSGMNASQPSNDMFGGMNSSTTATNTDMFGGMNPVSQPSNDAFGGMSAPQSNDMFGGMNSSTNAGNADMFGGMDPVSQSANDAFSGMTSNQPSNDMFGGMTAGASTGSSDMFGGMSSSQPSNDMFGGMSSSQPSNDMFGGMTAPQSNSDMFGGMTSSQPSNDMFGGMNMQQDMFSGM